MVTEKFMYGDIEVFVSLPQRVNIVRSDSGVGKSFLSIVLPQLNMRGFNVVVVKYDNFKTFDLNCLFRADEKTMVVFDNADIYMSEELKNAVISSEATCLIFTRDTRFFNVMNSGICVVSYDGKQLQIREVRCDDYF